MNGWIYALVALVVALVAYNLLGWWDRKDSRDGKGYVDPLLTGLFGVVMGTVWPIVVPTAAAVGVLLLADRGVKRLLRHLRSVLDSRR